MGERRGWAGVAVVAVRGFRADEAAGRIGGYYGSGDARVLVGCVVAPVVSEPWSCAGVEAVVRCWAVVGVVVSAGVAAVAVRGSWVGDERGRVGALAVRLLGGL
ncbi:hypothetical protein GCM10009827_001800 [Dactylosporangium maewongense]|uniref:Uncharacterized protein n=1 Tax=Dactylosporangium maewongense TaxID=634393 RepID=A0ABP4K837_9ACTN